MIRPAMEMPVVSGPPLSVGRLRQNSSRDPHMHWRGVGLTACIGTFDLEQVAAENTAGARLAVPRHGQPSTAGARLAVPRLLREMPSEDDAIGGPPRSTRAARARRMLAGFFESGGEEIVVLDDARFASAAHWIGDDGGPGRRSGIFQLLDMQDVSTLVVLDGDADARQRVLGVARRRPDKLFLFRALSPSATADRDSDESRRQPETEFVSFLLPNAAEVGPFPVDPFPPEPAHDDRTDRPAMSFTRRELGQRDVARSVVDRVREVDGSRDIGSLVAMLSSTDFSDQPRYRGRPVAARWPERSPGVVRLMAWRRWEGLRRSLELGTRWTVMELHHPLVWRHVERDVRGFLHRMAEYGLVQGPGSVSSGFQVRCTPRSASASAESASVAPRAVVPAVDIRVSVRLKPPYDLALSAGSMSGSDLDLPTSESDEPRPSVGRGEAAEEREKDPIPSGEEEPS